VNRDKYQLAARLKSALRSRINARIYAYGAARCAGSQ